MKVCCYCCEREVDENDGEWQDRLYDELAEQIFMCNDCLEADAQIEERFANDYEYENN